ncbi:Disease resistance response protein [Parasponia andersonii]|uniref:Dirigent protein n=1 Tax=Parasponia andersonii TaxID=3476 RepID=A0A2P5BCB5_PARAD|nr:Disease resistance response protein [Parasponia andersonii]
MANMLGKLDQLVILFPVVVIMVCSTTTTTTEGAKPNVTRIQFYMHDIVGGSNPTAVRVAGRVSNYSGSSPIATTFRSVYVMDNSFTATPDPNSMLVGRAQGIYAMSSQHNVFTADGPYNESTFSVIGRNPVMDEVREMLVVGGTGLFRSHIT